MGLAAVRDRPVRSGGICGCHCLGCGHCRGGLEGCCSFEEAEQFHREGQHEGRVLLGGDLDDSLQHAQLQRGQVLGDYLGGLASLSEARSSPSAMITRDRRSRSASAWRDMDRFIDPGSATSLTSTRSMCTPIQNRAMNYQSRP